MRRLIPLLLVLILSTNCLALQKNVASQKWYVFAFDDTDNSAKTGDAAQITANIRIDGGAADGVDDTNPTELEDGYYVFDLAQGETNGDYILICPASSTSDIQVIGCPMAIWTTPPYFSTLSIDSNGRLDIIKVAGTTQTANDMSGDIDTILIDTAAIEPIVTDLQGFSELGDKIVADIDANSVLANGTYGLSALEALVDDIGVAGAGLTAINLPNQTMDITGDIIGNLSGSVGSLTGHTNQTADHTAALTTAQNDLDTITGGSGVLIDTDAVDADALKTDFVTEIWAQAMSDLVAGAPSATASVLTAINYLYEAWRNQTWATSTEIAIYKNGASTKLVESTISDDGTTFKRGEMRAEN